jgi:hypothetical protein
MNKGQAEGKIEKVPIGGTARLWRAELCEADSVRQ